MNKQKVRNRIFFNADKAEIDDYYVLFVDVMGMTDTMNHSLMKSLNFVGRLHSALLSVHSDMCKDTKGGKIGDKFKMIPVIDGAFVISKEFNDTINFIRDLFIAITTEFMNEEMIDNKFIIRAGLSFGPLALGCKLEKCTKMFKFTSNKVNMDYRDSLAIGLPVTQAHQGEKEAPPFGVYIDHGVRIKQGKRISGIWYRWFNKRQDIDISQLREKVKHYFEWAKERYNELEYPSEKINKHMELACQYFQEFSEFNNR